VELLQFLGGVDRGTADFDNADLNDPSRCSDRIHLQVQHSVDCDEFGPMTIQCEARGGARGQGLPGEAQTSEGSLYYSSSEVSALSELDGKSIPHTRR
jgi:hypothetical protein